MGNSDDDDSDAWDAANSLANRRGDMVEEEEEEEDISFFDCNICFHMATDPIVTTCGHLFCWPCIYQWQQQQKQQQSTTDPVSSSTAVTCPVCSGSIDGQYEIVPIYGRGKATTSFLLEEEKEEEAASSSESHDNVATKSSLLTRRRRRSSSCGASSSEMMKKIPPRPHAYYSSQASDPGRNGLWTYVAYLKDSFAPLLLLLQTIGFVISYELSDPA
jgi:hypothetical protein